MYKFGVCVMQQVDKRRAPKSKAKEETVVGRTQNSFGKGGIYLHYI